MQIYVASSPQLEESSREIYSSAAAEILKLGHQPFDPYGSDGALLPWPFRLEALMGQCQGLYLLKGWQNTIADTISAGLMEGKRSVEDFAKDMNNILTQAVTNAISAKILGPAIDELTNYLAEAMEDGILSPEEAERYKTMFGLIADEGKRLADASSAALSSVQGPDDNTLSGAIKGITEETAGVLAGQVNAMRINQVEGVLIMRQQLAHLAEIASNTRYNKHLEKLGSIDRKLDALSTDPLRATGLV